MNILILNNNKRQSYIDKNVQTKGFNLVNIILCYLFIESLALRPTPIIQTNKGPVQGEISNTIWNNTTYSAFKGIPYAKPPVGDLRFKPPVEAEPWKETLNAVQEGNACPQFDPVFNNLTGNEDCLYLNVYVPQDTTEEESSKKLKPVMVYIYGGSFQQGHGNASLYGPEFFLEEGVIVVTFNYRLGALGFLSLDHPEVLGNAGLKDQNLLLRWVQANIANFGGNPKEVTLVGQSAGAAAVDFHVLSEQSRGLFQRSITMSGSVLCPWAFHLPALAVRNAFSLGSGLGFATTDKDKLVEFLKKASAYDLARATKNLARLGPFFKPTLENSSLAPKRDIFMSECSIRKYMSGQYMKQPHMMGFMKDETLLYAQPLYNLTQYAKSALASFNENTTFFQSLRDELSVVKNELNNPSLDTFYELIRISSNVVFKAQIDYTQRIMSQQNGNPIFYYQIEYQTRYAMHRQVYNIDLDGAAHGDDIGYIFNTPILNIPTDPKDPFNIFRRKVVRLWSNFIKYANPTPIGTRDTLLNVTWPDSRFSGKQLIIDQNLVVKNRQVDPDTTLLEHAIQLAAPIFTGC